MSMYKLVGKTQGIITSEEDMTRLDFLDWNRTIFGPGRDMRGILNWLKGNMKYTIIQCDLRRAFPRDDFPDWSHSGSHVATGRLYWNWFHQQFAHITEKELLLSDSPDFCGSIVFPSKPGREEHRTYFWGDIGKVSIAAFVESFLQMRPGDLWISIRDEYTQLILESRIDFLRHSTHDFDVKSGYAAPLIPIVKPSTYQLPLLSEVS
jgi:hypothetical protein